MLRYFSINMCVVLYKEPHTGPPYQIERFLTKLELPAQPQYSLKLWTMEGGGSKEGRSHFDEKLSTFNTRVYVAHMWGKWLYSRDEAKRFDTPSYLELDIAHSVHSNTRSFIQQIEKLWNNTSSSISVLHTSSILYLTQNEYEQLVEILEQYQ